MNSYIVYANKEAFIVFIPKILQHSIRIRMLRNAHRTTAVEFPSPNNLNRKSSRNTKVQRGNRLVAIVVEKLAVKISTLTIICRRDEHLQFKIKIPITSDFEKILCSA